MRLWHRIAYAPFLAQVVVTRRCNLACGYCNEFDASSQPVAVDKLHERLEKLLELGTLCVEFTGGEPLLHPELEALVRTAKRMGFPRVQMISNAFLLDDRRIERLNEAGLYHLQVSVDGVKPNPVTQKVLKSLAPRLRLLARLARFKVTISAVIGSAADVEAIEVVRFAKTLGFRPRVLLIHDGDGQLALSGEQVANFRKIQREIGGTFSESQDYRSRLLTTGEAPFKCRAGSRYLYVDEFGDVSWCSQTRKIFSEPLVNYDVGKLREQFYTRKDCSAKCTVGCARTNSKLDNWRFQ